MRIALLFAPYRHKSFEENIGVVDNEFGVFPPISLARVAAIAERAGHVVMLLDAHALGLDPRQAARIISEFAPDLLGTYLSTYMAPDTLRYLRALRKEVHAPLLVGGINLSHYPRETLSHLDVDYGLSGQVVDSLPLMLSAIESGRLPRGVPGACYRDGAEVICEEPDSFVDFARLPIPARHLLPNERYHSIISQRRPFTIMTTATGCPSACTFCAIPAQRHSLRSAEQVIEEIEQCIERFGIREIDIFDADFPAVPERTAAICEAILKKDLRFEWSCRARISSVDPSLLRLMAKAGLRQIYYGIESSNPEALRLMKKPLKIESVRPAIDATRRAGIRPLGFFMLGVPGETRASLIKTILYSRSLGLDWAQFSRTIAKPGSALHKEAVQLTGRDFWKAWVEGSQKETRMGSHWSALGEREIELWTKLAYLAFFFGPRVALRALGRVRSAEELLRELGAATQLLASLPRFDRSHMA